MRLQYLLLIEFYEHKKSCIYFDTLFENYLVLTFFLESIELTKWSDSLVEKKLEFVTNWNWKDSNPFKRIRCLKVQIVSCSNEIEQVNFENN